MEIIVINLWFINVEYIVKYEHPMVRACSNLWKFWRSPQLSVGNIFFYSRYSVLEVQFILKSHFKKQFLLSPSVLFLLRPSLLNQAHQQLRLLQIFMFQACYSSLMFLLSSSANMNFGWRLVRSQRSLLPCQTSLLLKHFSAYLLCFP